MEGDICIVGAGPAGISIAMEWNNTPYKIILLEGGGLEYDDRVQDLYAGKTTGQKYYPLRSARLHYFGGTSNHWAGFCSTFDPIDFEKRDWIPQSGWPIRKTDLDPFYARAQQVLDLGPYEYAASYWQKTDPSMQSMVRENPVVWNKVWQFSPPTRFSEKYGPAIMQSKNIHLYTYANLVDISANEPVSAIRSVTLKNHEGKEHYVKARHFVLACCAIQNARILLASNKQAPRGLGNDNDLVGRYFMEHLEIKSAWLHLFKPDPLKLYALEYGVTRARCELAITRNAQQQYRILNGTASLDPIEIAKNIKPAIETWNSDDPRKAGQSFVGSMEEAAKTGQKDLKGASRTYELFSRMEQAPNPDSRVTLDQEKDALGMPRANLHWQMTGLEKRSIRKLYELIGQQVGAAGIGRVRLMEYLQDENDNSWPSFTGGGWHHMGTTRMSEEPKSGVVDPDCKVHGIANLFVAGSACFVTAAAPNPTLTLVALSLRLSDHLKGLLKTQGRSSQEEGPDEDSEFRKNI
jgi:choline dehydrogenase-like flavoprotein